MAQAIEQVGDTDTVFGWFKCTCTFDHFSTLDFRVGKKIESEYIQCDEKSPKWILCLYPGGYDNDSVGFVSCLLNVYPVYAFYRVLSGTLCNTERFLWSVNFNSCKNENECFSEKTVKTEELMKSLINDTLIFILHISYTNHFMKDHNRLLYPGSSIVISGRARPCTIERVPVDYLIPCDGHHFPVHFELIRAHSKLIEKTCVARTKGEKKACVELTDISKDLMELFIELVYTRNIVSMDIPEALQLLPLHTAFESDGLKGYCINYLKDHLSSENVCHVLVNGYFLDDGLKAKCISYFLGCWNPKFLENHRSVLVRYPILLMDILMTIAERNQLPPIT